MVFRDPLTNVGRLSEEMVSRGGSMRPVTNHLLSLGSSEVQLVFPKIVRFKEISPTLFKQSLSNGRYANRNSGKRLQRLF
jgi:hypothetical protein